jgi:transposase-like protein
MKINGTTIFIWGAVDLDDEKVVAVCVSFGRSGLEAKSFLKKVKRACMGELPRIFIDGGTWYPWALRVVGFVKYTVVSFGPRSAIERLFGDYLNIYAVSPGYDTLFASLRASPIFIAPFPVTSATYMLLRA